MSRSEYEKSIGTYRTCLYFGGFLGAHHYYTGNIGKGLLYTFTVGLLMFGWFRDMVNPRRDFNREMAAQGIHSNRGRN